MSQRQIFRITDLSGGLNPDQNEVLIADNEAAEILNFRIDKIGSLVSRKGYTHYVTEAEPNGILALGRWRDGDPADVYKVLIATKGGNIRVASDTWDNYTTVYSGLSTTTEGMFLPVQDVVLYANGVDEVVAYDGTDADPLGIEGPAGAPTGTLGGTGITGDYTYRYTYFSTAKGWESNPSPVSATLSPVNQTVTLTLVAATHAYADKIRIYRTVDGGATHLFLAEIASNLTTYADSTADSGLGLLAVDTTNDVPPVFENIAYHKGYLFGSIGNTIYWSKPLNIGAFPVLNSTEVPFEGNDTITALRSFQDTLMVFGHNNTVLLVGDAGNWSLIRQDVEIGCASRKAIAELEGSMVFLSYDALHVFPGFQQFAPKLTRTLHGTDATLRQSASLVYVPEERSLWLALDDQTWAIHLLNQGITSYNFYGRGYLRGGREGYSLPIWIDSTDSYLNQYGGSTDDGASIPLRWKSKVFQMANPEFTKFVRRVGVFATRGNGAALTLALVDSFQSRSITLTPTALGVSTWDDFNWDEANWSQEGFEYLIGALPAQTLIGRVLQLTLDADVTTETEIISPISVEYRESDRFLGAN